MKVSEQPTAVNGAESIADSKITLPPASEGKRSRAVTDSKADSAEKHRDTAPAQSARQFRDRQERNVSFSPAEAATVMVPALGRECGSEAEAIIDAFRERVSFYRLSEFQTRADVGPSGEPILRKDGLKKNNPAS